VLNELWNTTFVSGASWIFMANHPEFTRPAQLFVARALLGDLQIGKASRTCPAV
jgi:hypothetical protein